MLVTQKNQYALRAIFELARRKGGGPTKTSEIARAQAIPVRFLEVILNQLKRSGIVESKRGYYGGYSLVRPPEDISVGDVFRFMQGAADSLHCMACETRSDCPFHGKCAFIPLWNRVQKAIFDVYDGTTLQDLLDNENQTR